MCVASYTMSPGWLPLHGAPTLHDSPRRAAASPHDGPGPDCGVGTKQTHMLAELLAFPKEVASRELVRSVSHSNITVVTMARNHNKRNGGAKGATETLNYSPTGTTYPKRIFLVYSLYSFLFASDQFSTYIHTNKIQYNVYNIKMYSPKESSDFLFCPRR